MNTDKEIKPSVPERYESRPIEIYGIWAYKIKGDVDYSKPFPPIKGAKLISMFPGEKHSLDDINKNWLKQCLDDGLTHLMMGHGDSCQVMEKDKIKAYLKRIGE